MYDTKLTLITKPGCHLCDDAREVVRSVLQELQPLSGCAKITLAERSIADDPFLFAAYAEEIPVLLINDRVHTFWRVDPARLRRALLQEQE